MTSQFLHFERNAGPELTLGQGQPLNVDLAEYRALTFNSGPAQNVLSADGSQLMIPPLQVESRVAGGGGGTTQAGGVTFDQLLPGSFTQPNQGGTDASLTQPQSNTTLTGTQEVSSAGTTPTTGAPATPGGAPATTSAETQTAQPQGPAPGYMPDGEPIPGYAPDPFGGEMVPMWMRLAPGGLQAQLAQEVSQANSQQTSTGTPTDQSGTTSGTGTTGDGTQDPTQTAQTDQSGAPLTNPDGTPVSQQFAPATVNGQPSSFSSMMQPQTQASLETQAQPQSSQVSASNPNSYFLTQLQPDAPSNNENCGPTSLAMALEAFGKVAPQSDPEKLIEGVRQLMTGQDNVTSATNYQQIENGARAAGLNAQEVNGLAGINQALASGQMVLSAGNPDRPGAGAYGDSLSDSDYQHFNGRHIILVAGIDQQTGNYVINDPLSKKGSLEVTAQQLQAFLSDPTQPANNGGIAVGPASTGAVAQA